jgi:hypothetical protein
MQRQVNMPALLVSGRITGGAVLISERAGKSDGQAATQQLTNAVPRDNLRNTEHATCIIY